MSSYENWYGYCKSLSDMQISNVFIQESKRVTTTISDAVKVDSEAAVSACRVIAAERGLTL